MNPWQYVARKLHPERPQGRFLGRARTLDGARKVAKTPADLYEELKLTPTLREFAPFRRITTTEALQELGYMGVKQLSSAAKDFEGIAIAGFDLHGKPRGTYQVRRDRAEVDERGRTRRKYESRPASAGPRWINTTPGKVTSVHKIIIMVESPKATWAVAAAVERAGRKDIKVVDTSGLSGWLVKEGEDKNAPSTPNPDLALLSGRTIIHLPDSNVTAARPDLLAQAERLETYLSTLPHTTFLRGRTPALDKVNGPDDLLQHYGDRAFWEVVDAARPGWEWEFPAVSDFTDEDRKIELIVDHLIANKTITLFASASENYKTMAALALCRAMLTGEDAFEKFNVKRKVPGVLYNCPDMSEAVLLRYADQMKLAKCPSFRVRTMKQGLVRGPQDSAVQAAARAGYFIVLDTMGYFTGATDDYQAAQITGFFIACRQLIDVHGAAGILALVHPTKPGARSTEIDVTAQVSGTYSKIGSVDTIFVLRRVNDPTTNVAHAVWVSREKKRPFVEPLSPFTLTVRDYSGNCLFDEGRFPVGQLNAPKLSELLPPKNKGGAPETPDKEPKVQWMLGVIAQSKKRPTLVELAANMAKTFPGSKHGVKTLRTWLKEHQQDEQMLTKAATTTTAQ
jgi:hypothetical protein